ncbi:uncharacterized [Tachysurus ichikawai]
MLDSLTSRQALGCSSLGSAWPRCAREERACIQLRSGTFLPDPAAATAAIVLLLGYLLQCGKSRLGWRGGGSGGGLMPAPGALIKAKAATDFGGGADSTEEFHLNKDAACAGPPPRA